ncbi:MAG TPA: sugar transporter, partial [Cyanobacteria bacterium UBA12227]|nr:sugar transporter [Cyanobacteria bacterium UBA12227]
MKSLTKFKNGKYIGLLVSTTLCLVSGQVKASEPLSQDLYVFKNATQEVTQLTQQSDSLVLNGNNLTPSDVINVAINGAKVSINEQALERLETAHQLLLLAAKKGQPIYGLTQGVGLNKDQTLVDASGNLSEEVIERSQAFNRSLIYAHSAGAGSEMSKDVVRAIMTVRLNSILFGSTGVQPKVAELYRDFLNNDIVPVIPSRGSVGQADITLITHIGLAMIGEGEVYYQDQKIPASKALQMTGLTPLVPFGKDSLSILSSNAYSTALGALAVVEFEHALKISKLVFALSLEALDGNIEPFLEDVNKIRPFPEANQVSRDIQTMLTGSYLWDESKDRALQDPLSYRTGAYILGAGERSLKELQEQLKIQLNSSDDNPAVVLDVVSPSTRHEEASYYINEEGMRGAVLPTGNFSPLPWVISFQEAAIALSHLSNASAQRTIKLGDPHFTQLSRFLGTENTVHAYGAIQKTFVSLAIENQELAAPIIDDFAIAGNIEDVSTNAPRTVQRVRTQIDTLYYILGIEMMHAAQAIDLRLQKNSNLKLSSVTKSFFDKYREVVPF